MAKSIDIVIDKEGLIQAETIGYKGKACKDALKFTERLGDLMQETKKSDWYEPDPEPFVKVK